MSPTNGNQDLRRGMADPRYSLDHLSDWQIDQMLADQRRPAPFPPRKNKRRRVPPPKLTVPPSVIRDAITGDRLLTPQIPDMPRSRVPRLDMTDAAILRLSDADLVAALASLTDTSASRATAVASALQ